MKNNRALMSVSNKSGFVPFAQRLSKMGVEIVSTGGTAAILKKEGVAHVEMEQFTGFPEILGGRVKTLHPKVHGGLLFVRSDPDHQQQVETNQIEPIDLVFVNPYPFEPTINKPELKLDEAIARI